MKKPVKKIVKSQKNERPTFTKSGGSPFLTDRRSFLVCDDGEIWFFDSDTGSIRKATVRV